MAADVTGDGVTRPVEPDPVPDAPTANDLPPPVAVRTPPKRLHRRRFGVAYALLVAALGAGIAGVVLALGSSIGGGEPAWSSWQPQGGGLGAAREIAQHVAPSYRLPSGKQLVDVIANAPSVTPGNQTIPVHYLAVRGTHGSGDQIFDVSAKNTIMFSLCGLGQSCAIPTGTPSVARGRLVRREVLELSLYTFKYVHGIENVIAFMPPQSGQPPQYVVYLRKGDLGAQLGEPLAQTLRSKTPLPNTIPAHEVRLVDAATEPRLFSFSLSQAQQGDAILVLDPLSA